jgi:4-alpha-glucanotransferase
MTNLPSWLSKRSAGVLLHPSSLPNGHGIGCLGEAAYQWIDFLRDAGVFFWQMCPVGPTGYGDSPYQVFSSSAGNPYFIDWAPLVEFGYIQQDSLFSLTQSETHQVDFGSLYENFYPLMKLAFSNFKRDSKPLVDRYGDLEQFKSKHASWLEPYATFQSLKSKNNLKPWWEWPAEDINASNDPSSAGNEFEFHCFLQFLFRSQWDELHQYSKSKKISLIGDLPIYVAPDSVDAWRNKELFQINELNEFTSIAGVPPDYFNEKGQLWGNPLYNWERNKEDDYKWWIQRIRDQLDLFEVIRIDHFRAFHDYWSIPKGSEDAVNGRWEIGPGIDFWKQVRMHFPDLPFLAEDLGDINKQVRQLRDSIGLPGMAVLQFAFDGNPKNLYLPHNLMRDVVLYTGTHDNDTSLGWYETADESSKSFFRSYLNIDGSTPGWDMLRHAYRSVPQLVITPAQDLLSLGTDARFNKPGEASGNWNWRMTEAQFHHLRHHSTRYLREQAILAGRLSKA